MFEPESYYNVFCCHCLSLINSISTSSTDFQISKSASSKWTQNSQNTKQKWEHTSSISLGLQLNKPWKINQWSLFWPSISRKQGIEPPANSMSLLYFTKQSLILALWTTREKFAVTYMKVKIRVKKFWQLWKTVSSGNMTTFWLMVLKTQKNNACHHDDAAYSY